MEDDQKSLQESESTNNRLETVMMRSSHYSTKIAEGWFPSPPVVKKVKNWLRWPAQKAAVEWIAGIFLKLKLNAS